jgi:ABC-type amino acid transport substrate-binding protein
MKLERRQYIIGAVALALIVIGGGLFVWVRVRNRSDDTVWEQALASGVIRVGMDASYPPFEYVSGENEVAGFDVDFANEIGRRLDLDMVFINMGFDGLYDSLLVGQVEVLISALPATEDYAGKADFSVPYFNAGERLVLPVDSTLNIVDDLNEHLLSVEYGSGGDVEARKWERRLSGLEVARYPDADTALQAVINGEADAALIDGISARLGVGSHPELRLGDHAVDILFAVAVHPDSQVLRGKLDEVIEDMIEDGTVDELIEEWFGPQR